MTARVSLACNGIIPGGGYACRQAVYAGEVLTGAAAREEAAKHFGWTSFVDWSTGAVLDLCPQCSRRRAERAAADRAAADRAGLTGGPA